MQYYVDAQNGSDDAKGDSRRAAWKSIERVNRARLGPDDRVNFAAGQTFAGTLRFTGDNSGAPGRPILVSSFGRGRARIDGGAGDGFTLTDCAHVAVRDLHFVGCGRKNGSDGAGLRLTRTQHVELSGIDVSGFRVAGIQTGGDAHTRITHVRAHDNGFAGIAVHGGHNGLPRSRDLYIADCVVENNPGDPKNLTNHSGNGIVVGGVDGALIEYCRAFNNGWDMPRDGNGPVGIWAWNADRVIIQHCIAHGNKSPGADGGGFDFDGGVTDSVMQYNLSYDNAGCGYLLCQYPGATRWANNTVRYNISFNDGAKNFQSGIGLWLGDTGISDAHIYNNTVVNPVHAVVTLGDLPGMVYRNNLFVAGGDLLKGDFGRSRFEGNLYWTPPGGRGGVALHRHKTTAYLTLEEWSRATGQELVGGKVAGLYVDPCLVLPPPPPGSQKLPTDPRKLAAMTFGRLRPDSPSTGAGMLIPEGGGPHDLFGNRVAPGKRPSLGAHEPQK
jgi:hypothetical protein